LKVNADTGASLAGSEHQGGGGHREKKLLQSFAADVISFHKILNGRFALDGSKPTNLYLSMTKSMG
jgi:hypothetical protein